MEGVGVGMMDGVPASLGGVHITSLKPITIAAGTTAGGALSRGGDSDSSISSRLEVENGLVQGEHVPFVLGFPRW